MTSQIWTPATDEIGGSQMKPNQTAVFVPVAEVFPNTPATVEELRGLLRTISRTDALISAARLNLVLANADNKDHFGKQNYCISCFLSPPEIVRINQFIAQRDSTSRVFVFFRAQLLDLILWICRFSKDLPNDGKTFLDPEVRRAFSKAALISGELWGTRVYADRMDPADTLEAIRRRALGAMRMAAATTSSGAAPMMAIARGWRLFVDHFSKHCPEFADSFESRTGLTIRKYFALQMNLAVHYLGRTPDNVSGTNPVTGIMREEHYTDINPELGASFRNYCNVAALSPDELNEVLWPTESLEANHDVTDLDWKRFKVLRERPLLRTADGRVIVLDPAYFAESAAVGPLFAILSKGEQPARTLFERFGKAFESYVVSLFRGMYHQSDRLASPLTCDLIGQGIKHQPVQIADVCLDYVTELFLFEAKAVWLKDKASEDTDPEEYVRELREKYVRHQGDEPGAVTQIANVITKLSAGDWRCDSVQLDKVKRIYPVLLTHDSHLNAPLHPKFLSDEFIRELAPDEILECGTLIKGQFAVARLTILTVDDLEIMQRSIEKFSLRDAIVDYSKVCPDRLTSFYDFLATSDYRYKLIASGMLADAAIEALELAKEMMGR